MKKKPFVIGLFVLLCLMTFHFFSRYQSYAPLEGLAARIPIRFFPYSNVPKVQAEIEGKQYSLLLDMGFSKQIDLKRKWIDQIKDIKKIENAKFFDVKGSEYEVSGFFIPKVVLKEGVTFSNGSINEISPAFHIDGATLWPESGWKRWQKYLQFQAIDGSIGWPAFQKAVCLFDFSRSVLFVAERIDSLMNCKGYSGEDFVAAPFELKNFGAVLAFETDLGVKHLLLDTGATHSCLRESLVPKEAATEFAKDKRLYVNRKLSCGGQDLGSNFFVLFDITEKLDVDGILGFDFFEDRAVCLDFPNKMAYIQYRGEKPGLCERFICWLQGILV